MIDYELFNKEIERLGIGVDRYAADRFDLFAERLIAWNQKMNLTAITQPDEIVTKHFADSLAIVKYVNIPQGATVIDVGTGAGFPGLPLLFARPDIQLTLADSLHKRLIFIKDVLHSCGLMAERVHERAEVLGRDPEYREYYDLAVARAVAPLNVLCEYCLPFVKPGGLFVAMKGSADETEAAGHAIDALGGRLENNVSYKLSNGDARSLVLIRKISQTPTKYPRKTKKIDTKPL